MTMDGTIKSLFSSKGANIESLNIACRVDTWWSS